MQAGTTQTTMSIRDIESMDQRQVAIHECGHALVARHYGAAAHPRIWRNPTPNPLEEKTWLGTTYYNKKRLSPVRHRRMALAGVLAELMDDSSLKGPALEEAFEDSFLFDEWSESDRKGANGWRWSDFRATHAILKRGWMTLRDEAESLMRATNNL